MLVFIVLCFFKDNLINQSGFMEAIPSSESTNMDSIDNNPEESSDYLDVLDNKQILKKVIKEGNKEKARPEKGCRVKINLSVFLKDTDEKVESLDSIEIFVGDCDLNHAVDLIVPLMNVGEIAEVIVTPRFAYGEKGREPDIPPNASLKLIIELISIDWVEDLSEIEALERIKIGEAKKERGNFFFGRQEYSSSVMLYKRAIEFLEFDVSELGDDVDKATLDKLNDLKASVYNNLAQSQMKLEAFDAALNAVNNALAINEKNVKALFRKGKILTSKGDLQEALEVYKAASKLDPDNRLIKIEISQVSKSYSKQQIGRAHV